MNAKFLEKIQRDFPQFQFEKSDDFFWNFENQTIFYAESANFEMEILHELGHALNAHENFEMDVELLQMEVEAWETAREISKKYGVQIDENFAESALDTYRNWLHRRSLCPNCLVNGFQKSDLSYKCAACTTIWRANDSRFKELRRNTKKYPL